MNNINLKLFTTFFKIGAFTFGGGWAMISLLEKDIVDRNRWIEKEEFLDLLAISQSLPGIMAVNVAISVGYKLSKLKGSIFAALGTILPSFLIILAIAMAFTGFQDHPVVVRIFQGIRPVVVALIAVPMLQMALKANKTWWMWGMSAVTLLLVAFLNVSPVYILIVTIVVSYTIRFG